MRILDGSLGVKRQYNSEVFENTYFQGFQRYVIGTWGNDKWGRVVDVIIQYYATALKVISPIVINITIQYVVCFSRSCIVLKRQKILNTISFAFFHVSPWLR